MDISISFTMNGVERTIQPTLVNSVLIVLFLSICCILIGRKFKKLTVKDQTKGLARIAEIYVEGVESLTVNTMGKANVGFAPYIATLALYLVFANLLGLIGLMSPTADYNVTLTLALITVVLIHFNNIRFNGIGSYVKGYFDPLPLLFPINLLGEIATPISMSFRLFGNMLAGTILMTLIYSIFTGIGAVIAPFVTPWLHAYFDVFSGIVQTFVFIMLTMVFVSNGIGEREEK